MHGNIEIPKNNNVNKVLQEAQNNFSEIEEIIYGVIEFNFNDNLDDFSKKSRKIKKQKPEKSSDNSNPVIHEICTNPHTKEYLQPAILPSDKYWKIKQKLGDEKDGDNKAIYEVAKSIPFTLVPFSHRKFGHEDQKFIKIGTYVFVENTGISGLTRHLDNTNIFFVVSPCNGYMHTMTGGFKSEEDLMEKRKECGKKYLADVINEVKESSPVHTKISCIVLGKRAVEENMEAYDDAFFVINEEEDKEQHIEQYFLSRDGAPANTDVDVYNINAHGHELDLTTTDLEILQALADKTQKQAGADAIIVHCQQGMDRTGMLIFAFILYQNYDYYFTGKKKIENIYEAYKTLQWSRSPAALTKAADLVNAIYLAHTLKAIAIEKQCSANLSTLIIGDGIINDKKRELFLKLNQAKSNKEKLDILQRELKQLDIENSKREYIQYESPRRHESPGRDEKPVEYEDSGRHEIPKKHDSQKRRPRPSSCNLKEVTPMETFKKSSSEPDELHTHRSRREDKESKSDGMVGKNKSFRHSGGLFKRSQKTFSEDLKVPDSLHQPIIEDKKDVLIPNHTTNTSKLSSILELAEVDSQAGKEKADLDIKPGNTVTARPVKHSSGLFSLKGRKRQSDDKHLDLQNPSGIFMRELICLANVIQHRINTEDALQHRIYPKETESARFTIM